MVTKLLHTRYRVNDLEKTQAKADAALIDGGGKLQKVLSPEEWSALVSRVTPAGS